MAQQKGHGDQMQNNSGHSSSDGSSVSDFGAFGFDLNESRKSSSNSDANSGSDFGDFGFASNYKTGNSAFQENDYDIDALRQKNIELKRELRRVHEEYEAQGRMMGVTYSKSELVYMFLPAYPYTPLWHISPRGLEHTQLYFWIVRDVLWMQQNGDAACAIGAVCIALAAFSLLRAINAHHQTLTTSAEAFNSLSRLLWVVGMFVWMRSSVYDLEGNAAGNIYTPSGRPGRNVGTIILAIAAVIQFATCYLRIVGLKIVLMPDEAIPAQQAVQMKPFEEPRLRAKFYYLFKSFRDWEMAALLLWIGKDVAASQEFGSWWIIFHILIYAVTVFMLNSSLNTRKVLIDHLHYLATAFWLLGTFIFQLSHLYLRSFTSNPWEYLYPRHQTSEYVGNYMSVILTLLAFVPLGVLYLVWVPATLLGRINEDAQELVAWDVEHAETDVYDPEATHTHPEPRRIEENWLGKHGYLRSLSLSLLYLH